MNETEPLGRQIARAFRPVYGMKLSIYRNAGSMKNFQFGAIRPHPTGSGTIGQYALHIDCPWRFVLAPRASGSVSGTLMVTGSSDWWEPAERGEGFDWDDWNQNRRTPSIQQKALAELFTHFDEATRSWVNVSDLLVVDQVEADDFGGFAIHLSGDYRLDVFPDGRIGEQWRLFEPGTEAPHVVLEDEKLTLE